jgi:hypothetical protein
VSSHSSPIGGAGRAPRAAELFCVIEAQDSDIYASWGRSKGQLDSPLDY